MSIKLGIHGITGRMGAKVLDQALRDPFVSTLHGYSKSHLNSSPVTLVDSLEALVDASDVIIDFSSNEALLSLLKKSLTGKAALVIGTTGISSEIEDLLRQASQNIPIVYSANFSLGVTACLQAAEMLSLKLKKEFTVNISETHHIHKKDAPSGTALAFAKATGLNPPILSLREGEVIGKHQVFFSNAQEKIELTHEALTRETFAFGALFAAKALVLKPAGLYSLKDLLD